jgi:hypothetical protein
VYLSNRFDQAVRTLTGDQAASERYNNGRLSAIEG